MKKILVLLQLMLCCATLFAQPVFINEIHYDNSGADSSEGIEVAGPAGTDLTGYSLVGYNGSNGSAYRTITLSDTLTDVQNGYGVLFVPFTGLQNGSPDGIALVDASDSIVQFLSYEGSFTAVGGVADGLTSEDIGVSEASSTTVGFSLQLAGEGTVYSDFTWEAAQASTYDAVNTNQQLGTSEPVVFINELHYDNAGADANEGIELAGTAGLPLVGYSLVAYNGNGGAPYNTVELTDTLPDLQNGYGTVFVPITGLQNGSPDGIALVDPFDNVIQFLSYEGAFMAIGGAADSLMSTDIGVSEASNTTIGFSLQLQGTGLAYEDFTWAAAAASTYDAVNNGQTFGQGGDTPVDPEPVLGNVFINELHYDNAGADTNEGVELAGEAGLSLVGYSLVAYNGNGGAPYQTVELTDSLLEVQNGIGIVFIPITGLQNGSPDGIALAFGDSVIQFISYEGSMTATGGVADGLTSEDIGVAETSSTPAGFSLQLTGEGTFYSDFTWAAPAASTYGAVNTGQSFGGGVVDPPLPTSDTVTIAQARALPAGTDVVVFATLTATDQFGGPAYMQDSTAGIAVFDYQVHGDSLFMIGDQVWMAAKTGAFRQQIQLVDVDTVILEANVAVTPTVVTLADLINYEGQLVTIENVTFDDGGVLLPNSNFDITDPSGTSEVRIDADVDLVGRLIPDSVTTVTGVVGRFNNFLQILPRATYDLPDAKENVPGGSDIPFDQTFDVATWNMEFFGSSVDRYGPSNVPLQRDNAIKVIQNLNADIIAIQEMSEDSVLQEVINALPNYDYVCSDVYSYSFNGPDPSFPPQKLCFMYNTTVVSNVSDKVLFDQFYTDARTGVIDDLDNHPGGSARSFWSSGRLPYMLTADVTVQGVTEQISLVNIHGKSGSSSGDLARRRYDVAVLKDTLDAMYPDANLILLGDYNDDVDESIGGGASTYLDIVIDTANYSVPTASLSEQGLRSFLFGDSMIDHIAITDELTDDFIQGSEQLFFPFSLIDNYANTTSDHLPVMARFDLGEPVAPLVATISGDEEIVVGYGADTLATLSVEIEGGLEPYTILWSTYDSTNIINVTPTETTLYEVSVFDASGQIATDTIVVYVEDVSCGRNGNRVQLCYNGRNLCVPTRSANRLLRWGAELGSCGDLPPTEALLTTASVYPNVVRDEVTLSLDAANEGVLKVEIFDFCKGKVVSEEVDVAVGTSSFTYDLSAQRRGIYLMRLSNAQTGKVEKIIRLCKR